MEEKQFKSKQRLWRRIIALVCAVALMISMFTFLSHISIEDEDGIGAETLKRYDEYANADAAERAGYAAGAYLGGSSTFDNCYRRASIEIGKANYEKALGFVQRCLEMCGENTEAALTDDLWLKYGCLQAVLGSYDEALSGFANMSDDSAYAGERELISAQIALEREDMATAYTHLNAYLVTAPEDISVYGLYADACYYTRRFDEALTWYGKAQERGTELDSAEELLWGLCLMEQNSLEAAMTHFAAAVERGYSDPSLCYSQTAICCYLLGRYEDTVVYGSKALEGESETVDYGALVLYMGLAVFSLEDYVSAVTYFDTAESLGCREGELWFYRGFASMMAGDTERAVQDLSTAAEFDLLRGSALLYRGICYLQREELDKAEADLESAAASGDETVSASALDLLTQLREIGAEAQVETETLPLPAEEPAE